MRLVRVAGDCRVIGLSPPERQALDALLRLRGAFPDRPAQLTREEGAGWTPVGAGDDLQDALKARREELAAGVSALLQDEERCATVGKAFEMQISPGDGEMLLQMLNQTKIAAWHSLGRPDRAAGARLEPTEGNLLARWAWDAADYFQSGFLQAFDDGMTGRIDEDRGA